MSLLHLHLQMILSLLRDREGKRGGDIVRAKSFAQVGSNEDRHAMSISADDEFLLYA